ncbi:ATP-dependent helicase HrpB [Paractinoplanes maris]|uniref:ATP-dependent helicase HrpB n=1 Tax=Paractinoplanes maris TaxID=1734446 RepID=UPI0020222106|nr:ATP-dependent helicase HrpB [Actinoplanes maris]
MADDALPDLPIRAVLPQVREALSGAGAAVLVAPPGTGKTTLVPLALPGRVVVAEPRRLAARAAARRMASLLGERPGEQVGYTVRGDRQVSRRTRVEVVTTGVLVRRLQRDPELAGTAAVMLDECHERHLDTDLALAFLLEVRAALRPDLHLLATSATADAGRLSEVLGAAPVVTATAPLFPVEQHWVPPTGPITPPLGLRVDPRLLDHVAATTRRALTDGDGDVLVFLPGAREIDAVATRLAGVQAEVIALHGRQPGAVQDAALRPSTRRRVVLSTAVAESSLTVPGVRAVVDAGLSRVPRMDHARGLGALVTVAVSRASAVQRAGRAGREAPGRVYRCWSQAQHDRLPAQPEPEVAAADLTGFALDLALWGHPDGSGLSLPDQPPPGALQAAVTTLRGLGAVGHEGRVTARGRALADAGLHPRLARALLDGAPLVGARRAAEIVALLDDERSQADDLTAAWRRARGSRDPAWRSEVSRLSAALNRKPADETTPDVTDAAATVDQPDAAATVDRPDAASAVDRPDSADASRHPGAGPRRAAALPDDLAAGLVVGLAYPERVARVREAGGRSYLMAGGTAAELTGGSGLAGVEWLAIASADRTAGARTARVRAAVPLDEATAVEAARTLLTDTTEIGWTDGDVVARTVRRLGAITLVERRIADPDRQLVRAALLDGLRREGLGLLTWSRGAVELRERLAFAHAAIGEPWPDVSDQALSERMDDWLELGNARRRSDLGRIDVATSLRRLLPWSVAGRLDEVAPERLPVPSGSRVRVDYSDPAAPVLAVKVQEAFGWKDAPRLADGRIPVLLHLLSPAGRPVGVTRDLASFWVQGYPQVRAELRGRYPRHPWPEDPTTAASTKRTNPRSR